MKKVETYSELSAPELPKNIQWYLDWVTARAMNLLSSVYGGIIILEYGDCTKEQCLPIGEHLVL